MNTILTQTGQQLVISDIDHKIEEYYNSRTDSNQYSWMPRLPSHIQELWNELSLHNGAPTFPYIRTIIHIYGVQQRDEVYTLSANVTHQSPIYQNGETQWFRIYIDRYPNPNEYRIECKGHNQVNGDEVKIRKMVPLSLLRNRDRFMDYIHRLCVDMSKETLDVEGELESAYNHDAFFNPNGQYK